MDRDPDGGEGLMAVIDARARCVCNLGPVISGSLSDSHIQGGGMIFTTGSLELAGLFNHPAGTRVKMAFAGNGRLSAAPRNNLLVLSCLANPLTRRTQVELGCGLTYRKNKGVGRHPWWHLTSTIGVNLDQQPKPHTTGVTSYLYRLLDLCGLSFDSAWTNTVDQYLLDDFEELGSGYLGKAADILSTFGYFAYASSYDAVRIRPLPGAFGTSASSTIIDLSSIIDLQLTSGGEDPVQQAIGAVTYSSISVAPEEVQQEAITVPETPQQNNPTAATQPQPQQQVAAVSYQNKWRESSTETVSFIKYYKDETYDFDAPVREKVVTTEIVQAPDNRVRERVVQTVTGVGRAAGSIVQDMIDSGLAQSLREEPNSSVDDVIADHIVAARRNAALPVDRYIFERMTYEEVPVESEPTASGETQREKRYRLRSKTVLEWLSDLEVFGRLPARNHSLFQQIPIPEVLDLKQYALDVNKEDAGNASLIERILEDYKRPSGSVVEEAGGGQSAGSQLPELTLDAGRMLVRQERYDYLYSDKYVKETKRVWVANGETQAGQYQINKAMKKARQQQAENGTRYLIDPTPFLNLYAPLVLDDVQIQFKSVDDEEEQPPSYPSNYEIKPATEYAATSQDTGATADSNSRTFEVPAPPDDVPDANGLVRKANVKAIAANYARNQNALIMAHRFGAQLTVPLGVLPPDPLSLITVRVDGISGVYLINGTSWAFDSDSCLVSTDAGYLGVRTS